MRVPRTVSRPGFAAGKGTKFRLVEIGPARARGLASTSFDRPSICMPADPVHDSELRARLAAALERRFLAGFARRQLEVTPAARELLLQSVLAQVRERLVPADRIVESIERIPTDGLPDFYLLKFGPKPLTYNRMIRLLGDMHDQWIAGR